MLEESEGFDLDVEVVAAVVCQESGGDTWSIRYEHGFFLRYVEDKPVENLIGYVPRPVPSLGTERRARATSWGLMQVMGQTARELGFDKRFLSELCDPGLGLHYGCMYLAKQLKREKNNYKNALLRYNGGGDPDYANKVFNHIKTGRTKVLLGSE